MHQGKQFSLCLFLLLYQKERWTPMTSSRLSTPKQMDNQKSISLTFNTGFNQHIKRSQIIHQTGRMMGIQQHMNSRRRWMEGSVHYTIWFVWTAGNVFWIMQFTSNISNYDGLNLCWFDITRIGTHLHRWHSHLWRTKSKGTPSHCSPGVTHSPKKSIISQTREMWF